MRLLMGIMVAALTLVACASDDEDSGADSADPMAVAMMAQDMADMSKEVNSMQQDSLPDVISLPDVVALPPMLGPLMHGGGPLTIHMGPEVLEMDAGPGAGPAGLMDLLDMGPFAEVMQLPPSSNQAEPDPLFRRPGGLSVSGAGGGGGPGNIFDMLDRKFQEAQKAAGDFQVSRQGDKVQLVAMLPDYKDSPPSVEILGNSLVVHGQKVSGNAVHSFQRSFQLPKGADVDAIHVEYSKSDGKLTVDVPANSKAAAKGAMGSMTLSSAEEEADGPESWDMGPLGDGSQMTITFSSSGGAPPPMPFFDPLVGLLLGHAPFVGHHSENHLAERRAGQAGRPALAVQPKNARPFWRLVDNGHSNKKGSAADPALEIVAPRGIDLGKVEGSHVATYNSSNDVGLRGQRTPLGQLQLPVSLGDQDCKWASGADSVSPWLPLWLLGVNGVIVYALVYYVAQQRRSIGKMSRKLELRVARVAAVFCGCCVVLGVLLTAHLLHQHRTRALEERVLHCKLNPASLKKLGVHEL